MNFFHTIILGIVEGITEFLPISSTGHLILTSDLLGLAKTEFLSTFEIFIQLGAILAVVVLYFKKFILKIEVWKKVLTAFFPTAIIGFVLYKIIKNYLLNNTLVVLWALFIGGILIIIFEYIYSKYFQEKTKEGSVENISYKQSFLIGICQSLAVIPGVSRAAATILGGLSLGLSRKVIVEFSFLLAIPTMLAATGYDIWKTAPVINTDQIFLLILGFITSFIIAIFAIKFFLKLIKNHSFMWFGVYRIILAVLFYLIIF